VTPRSPICSPTARYGWLSRTTSSTTSPRRRADARTRPLRVQQSLASSAFTDVMARRAWKSLPRGTSSHRTTSDPAGCRRHLPARMGATRPRSLEATWRWSPTRQKSPTSSRRQPKASVPPFDDSLKRRSPTPTSGRSESRPTTRSKYSYRDLERATHRLFCCSTFRGNSSTTGTPR